MTIEEAIKYWERAFDMSCRNNLYQNAEKIDYEDAVWMAISALRVQQEAEKNEPLKREQLCRMDGQPVWIEFYPDPGEEQVKIWALVSVDPDDGEIFLLNSLGGSSAYEEVWSDIEGIYRRPRKGGTA